MTWLNPWGLLGVLSAVIPVLVHALTRQRARDQRFPSLAFIAASRLTPKRRRQLSDMPLLLVRLAMLVFAAIALAQPSFRVPTKPQRATGAIARAIVLDTGASMQRAAAGGRTALDEARARAALLADSSQTSTVLATYSPSNSITGAIAWLETQTSRRELVVLSDFQAGSLDGADLARVPSHVGIRLTRLSLSRRDSTMVFQSPGSERMLTARTTITPIGTSVEWSATVSPPANPTTRQALELLVADSEQTTVAQSRSAAGAPKRDVTTTGGHAVAVVYPQFADRGALARSARLVDEAWMLRALDRIRLDSTLLAIASAATASPNERNVEAGVVLLRDEHGRVVVSAAKDSLGGASRLLLFADIDVGSLLSAALVSVASKVLHDEPALEESEPGAVPTDSLQRWSRSPSDAIPTIEARKGALATSRAFGRWVWLAVLATLFLEYWMRREKRGAPPRDAPQ